MPEYSPIQTYVKCNEDSFSLIIADFISVLTEIGFDENFLLDSFRDLEWEVCNNGFVYVGTNVESVKINLFGTELNIRPHVMG